MSFMLKLQTRWDRRQTGLEPLTLQSLVSIAAPSAEVWNFLMAPEAALVTGDGVVRSFRVPGTPIGEAGEQQCVVLEVDGRLTAHIAELVIAEPTVRIVARWLTMPNEVVASYLLADDKQGGTLLTGQLGLRVALGTSSKAAPELQAHLHRGLRRARAAIESGARFPSQLDE